MLVYTGVSLSLCSPELFEILEHCHLWAAPRGHLADSALPKWKYCTLETLEFSRMGICIYKYI